MIIRPFLRNTRIARKFAAIFVVMFASLCGVELINVGGMQVVSGGLRSAIDGYGSSRTAAKLDLAVTRSVAAKNDYLRVGGGARAGAVSESLTGMKLAVSELTERTAGLASAADVEKTKQMVAEYARSFDLLYKADQARIAAGDEAAKRADQLSVAFMALARGATNTDSRSMLSDITATYGTFSRLSANMARFASSMADRDESSASTSLDDLEKQVSDLRSSALLAGLKAEHDAATEQIAAFRAAFDQIRTTTRALNEQQENLAAMSGQILLASNRLSQTFARTFDRAIADLSDATRRVQWQSLLLAAALSILTALLIWFISQSISRPINAMTGAMTRLARHDWATEIVGADRRDEIGQMAKALLVLKDSSRTAEELRAQIDADRVKSEETRRMTMINLADAFERAVGSIVGHVAQAAREMAKMADQMAEGVQATKVKSASAAATSQDAAQSVQNVAAAVEELTSSGHAIAEQAASSDQATKQAVSVASKADAEVRHLVEAAVRIEDVTKIISKIASQTNLLALNATIEAASAGEAGRGFAVVASEVKNLALQTAGATDEITSQIAAIQSSTDATVGAIQSVNQTITKVNEISQIVLAAIEMQRAATLEISENTQNAFRGTQLVAEDVAGVTAAAQQSGEAAERVRQASNELSIQADTLGKEVERFIAQVRDT